MKLSKKLGLAASLAGALFLAACGDDGSSGKPASEKDGTASVPTYDDLAHCTKSHYGEIVFVEEESAYFECTSEDWAEVDESKLDSLLAAASSSSEADEDKPKSSSSLKADSTETADVEKVEVDSITVKGFAQKGPFASGTAVTVYGLDSLLEKTKTKFTGKVSGDSGAFKVEKIVLPSQYALVEVSGYYQNEVTGKKTSGSKTTLSALVDLSEGKTVKANVNLFTDLEYARAKHLVLKEKFNVPAAKKRATKELLSVFGGKGDDDLTATALSLSDTTSAGKALLFASILLQGDLSASKFGILLGGIEEFFGSTGGLDSAEATAAFADWASKVDSTDNFAAIRENVKSMKLVAAVPDFESALYAFWTNEYGLGACTDSLESTIEKNSNKKSENYGAGYACTAKRWHKATALDTELGLCTGKMEGQFKEYKGGKTAEYYVCKAGSWNKITETQFELKECTEDRDNEYVATKSKEYFVCTGKQWLEIDDITYELKLCTEKRNMEVASTKKAGTYVCHFNGKDGSWDKLSELEEEIGVCGSEDVADSTLKKTESGSYYMCSGNTWVETDGVTFGLGIVCTEGREGERKKLDNEHFYACESGSWTEITGEVFELGFCTAGRDGEMQMTPDSAYWHCSGGKWNAISEAEFVTKKFCNKDIDSTFVNGYACVHTNSEAGAVYNWRKQSAAEKANNAFCTRRNMDSTRVQNGYTCLIKDQTLKWRTASEEELATGKPCNTKVAQSVGDNVVNGYVCGYDSNGTSNSYSNYHWRVATAYEIAAGKVCSYKMKDSVFGEWTCLYLSSTGYFWRPANAGEIATGMVCRGNLQSRLDTIVHKFICAYDGTNSDCGKYDVCQHYWRLATSSEIALGSACGYYSSHDSVYADSVCTSDGKWRAATQYEKETNKVCNKKIVYTIADSIVCDVSNSQYQWRRMTDTESKVGKVCTGETYKLFTRYKSGLLTWNYRCVDTLEHKWDAWVYDTILDSRESGEPKSYRILDALIPGDKYKRTTTIMVDNFNFHGDGAGNHNQAWWCYNSSSNTSNAADCEDQGSLYHWTAPVNRGTSYLNNEANIVYPERGICPSGWHVPSESELEKLAFSKEYGTMPSTVYGSYIYSPSPGSFNSEACWWTTQQLIRNGVNEPKKAIACSVNETSNITGKLECTSRDKHDGCYLRCIKDE